MTITYSHIFHTHAIESNHLISQSSIIQITKSSQDPVRKYQLGCFLVAKAIPYLSVDPTKAWKHPLDEEAGADNHWSVSSTKSCSEESPSLRPYLILSMFLALSVTTQVTTQFNLSLASFMDFYMRILQYSPDFVREPVLYESNRNDLLSSWR